MSIRQLLIASIAVISAGQALAKDPLADVCVNSQSGIPCVIPFEALYAHRASAIGRLVSVDGVLIIGRAPEPPGNSKMKALLFPSIERAKSCNFTTAVEVI